jgi:hypothetical protein
MTMTKAFAESLLIAAVLVAPNWPQSAKADPHDILGWTQEMQTACNRDAKCQAAEGVCFNGPWKDAVRNLCGSVDYSKNPDPWNRYCDLNAQQWCVVYTYRKCVEQKLC